MSILKDSLIYTFGEVIAKSIPFLLIPYLTNKLGLAGYGELALIQSYIILIHVFVGLSQNAAVARYYHRYGHRGLGSLIVKSFIISLVLVSPVFIFALICHNLKWLLIGGCAFFQIHFLIQLSLRQSKKQASQYVGLQFSFNVLLLIMCVFYYEFIGGGYVGYFFSTILAYIIVITISCLSVSLGQAVIQPRKYRVHYSYLLSFGAGLVFHQLALFGKSFFDRIIISSQFSDEELGIYSIGYQVASVLQVLFVAINTAIVPYFYQSMKIGGLGRREIIRYSNIALLIIPAVGGVAYFLPDKLFLMLFGSVEIQRYFFLFAVAISINASYFVLANYYFYHSKTLYLSKVNTISVFLHIFLVMWLSGVGIELVPYSLIISNLVLVLGLLYRINRWKNG